MPTDDEIRRTLAEKCMGCHADKGYYFIGSEIMMPITLWNPPRKIEQALACAEQFDYYECGKDMSSAAPYWCQIFRPNNVLVGEAIGMYLASAIACACYRAAMDAKQP